jgi:hypothetical protein
MRHSLRALLAALLCGLSACAATEPAAVTPTALGGASLRLMVQLEQVPRDTRALADEVALAAGVPARYVSAASPNWHALVLQCADGPACEAAWQRLVARRPAGIEFIQRDERRRSHAAP